MRPRRYTPRQRAIAMVETEVVRTPFRFGSQMPFPHNGRVVARVANQTRKRHRIERKPSSIDRRGYSESAPIASGQKARSGGAADWSYIMLLQLYAFTTQPVKIECGNISPMEFHIRPSQIIGDYKNNIGLSWRTDFLPVCSTSGNKAKHRCCKYLGKQVRKIFPNHNRASQGASIFHIERHQSLFPVKLRTSSAFQCFGD